MPAAFMWWVYGQAKLDYLQTYNRFKYVATLGYSVSRCTNKIIHTNERRWQTVKEAVGA